MASLRDNSQDIYHTNERRTNCHCHLNTIHCTEKRMLLRPLSRLSLSYFSIWPFGFVSNSSQAPERTRNDFQTECHCKVMKCWLYNNDDDDDDCYLSPPTHRNCKFAMEMGDAIFSLFLFDLNVVYSQIMILFYSIVARICSLTRFVVMCGRGKMWFKIRIRSVEGLHLWERRKCRENMENKSYQFIVNC